MSSLLEVKDITLFKNAAVLRLTQRQARALSAAITKGMKEMKHMFEGIQIMTIPVLHSKILISVFNGRNDTHQGQRGNLSK